MARVAVCGMLRSGVRDAVVLAVTMVWRSTYSRGAGGNGATLAAQRGGKPRICTDK